MKSNQLIILGDDAIKTHLIDGVSGVQMTPEQDSVFFDIGLHMNKKQPIIMRISLNISPSIDGVPFSSEESKMVYFANLRNHMVKSLGYTNEGLKNWISGVKFDEPKYAFDVSVICTETIKEHLNSGVLSFKITHERYKPSELDKYI